VNGVAFSPDGTLLASADGDGAVRLSNPDTGEGPHAPLFADPASEPGGQHPGVSGVAFNPHGTLLAGGDGTVQLWDPATGREAGAPLQAGNVPAANAVGVAFSPDGTLLASADDDGTELRASPPPQPAPPRRAPASLSTAAARRKPVNASGRDQTASPAAGEPGLASLAGAAAPACGFSCAPARVVPARTPATVELTAAGPAGRTRNKLRRPPCSYPQHRQPARPPAAPRPAGTSRPAVPAATAPQARPRIPARRTDRAADHPAAQAHPLSRTPLIMNRAAAASSHPSQEPSWRP